MIKNAAPEYPIVLLFNDTNLRITWKTRGKALLVQCQRIMSRLAYSLKGNF